MRSLWWLLIVAGCNVDPSFEIGGCEERPSDPLCVKVDGGPGIFADAGPAPVFDTLIIYDVSDEVNQFGTAGVDICGVSADCASPVSAELFPGMGDVCMMEGPDCSANRGDPDAAVDDGASCEPDSLPSDYVSIGVEGTLAIKFDGDLTGCQVTVIEFAGVDTERYSVLVCADADQVDCLNFGAPIYESPAGGDATFDVMPDDDSANE